jgi:hypothetical protein
MSKAPNKDWYEITPQPEKYRWILGGEHLRMLLKHDFHPMTDKETETLTKQKSRPGLSSLCPSSTDSRS